MVDPSQSEVALGAVQAFFRTPKDNADHRARHVIRLLGPAAKCLLPEMLRKHASAARQGNRIAWAVTIAVVDPAADNAAASGVHRELVGMGSTDGRHCDEILYELAQVGPWAKGLLPDLKTLLTRGELLQETIEVLRAIGPDAKDALPLLRALQQNGSRSVREEARRAIQAIEGDADTR